MNKVELISMNNVELISMNNAVLARLEQGQYSFSITLTSIFNPGLRYVYTLRLIGPISYLGACYIRTKVTKCIREK